MNTSQTWHIVKFNNNAQCHILASAQVKDKPASEIEEKWGPFGSQQEAFSKRVGLIRARRCQPA
ncbi:MAG: hypothetical protein WA919_17780 [Coleofasciculaceae cyanobacterium]